MHISILAVVLTFLTQSAWAEPIYYTFRTVGITSTFGHAARASYADLEYVFVIDRQRDGQITDVDGSITRYADRVALPSYPHHVIDTDYFFTGLVRGQHLNGGGSNDTDRSINVGDETTVSGPDGSPLYRSFQMAGGDVRGLNYAVRYDSSGSTADLLAIGDAWEIAELHSHSLGGSFSRFTATLVSVSETNPVDEPEPFALLLTGLIAAASVCRLRGHSIF